MKRRLEEYKIEFQSYIINSGTDYKLSLYWSPLRDPGLFHLSYITFITSSTDVGIEFELHKASLSITHFECYFYAYSNCKPIIILHMRKDFTCDRNEFYYLGNKLIYQCFLKSPTIILINERMNYIIPGRGFTESVKLRPR